MTEAKKVKSENKKKPEKKEKPVEVAMKPILPIKYGLVRRPKSGVV